MHTRNDRERYGKSTHHRGRARKNVSDLIWRLAMVSDTLLQAVCRGQTPPVPVKPEENQYRRCSGVG